MNGQRKCTACGADLTDDAARGLCPRCLLQAGLESRPDPDATVASAGGGVRRRALPEVGERFGPYRILRQLGRGGMGVVYEAEEQDTARRVALKVLDRKLDSPGDRARFLREGRLAASINHPNSVYVYGTDEIDGTPTIAMELVAGGTLQERVKAHGPMPVPAAVDAVLQIVAGLEAAQAIGILHRDVKPGNCFEDIDGTIKIGDFGLSISTAAREEANITASGTIVGTPAFCSPEQLRGEELNARSDMYSVGATLFYLLTGRVPFEGHNIVQLTASVLEKPPPSPRGFRKEIPKGLASVVQRCLAKQDGERFKTYGDLRQALAPYGAAAPTPATLSLRFLAGVLDHIVLSSCSLAVTLLCFSSPLEFLELAAKHSPKALLWMFGTFSVTLLYYALFEGLWGASAGKAICRLRVVGPDRNPPGFLRALLRALIYVVAPVLPLLAVQWVNPPDIANPTIAQQVVGSTYYVLLALLFCTARRRNGFAAVQDLVSKTRVISREAFRPRGVLPAAEMPRPAGDARPTIGPYHVLEAMETASGQPVGVPPLGGRENPAEAGTPTAWFLGYDLQLLRKVWIRTVPPGTPPVAAALQNIGRVGRLRWLAGRRSETENWDAFEGVGGQPLLRLAENRQNWSQVRFWLYDLAKELSAAEKDHTLPETLAADRVWITADGRAKLLDFPAPGLADGPSPAAGELQRPTVGNALRGVPLEDAPCGVPLEHGTARSPFATVLVQSPALERAQQFLSEVAVTALEGRSDAAAKTVAAPAVPLPLHARDFLMNLPRPASRPRPCEHGVRHGAGPATLEAIAAALEPLLRRVTTVSRLRRAAVVAGCLALPVLASFAMFVGLNMIRQTYPGVMELAMLLHARPAMEKSRAIQAPQANSSSPGKNGARGSSEHNQLAHTDRQLAIYIASHYRATIADDRLWKSPVALSMIKGDERRFVERSIAEHPAPTAKEIADADEAIKPIADMFQNLPNPLAMGLGILAIYVCLPALIAALLFRGGLALRAAGIALVRRDGRPASRLCVFWRALVAWVPLGVVPLLMFAVLLAGHKQAFDGLSLWIGCGGGCILVALSLALPRRGLPDRLAGIWPVSR